MSEYLIELVVGVLDFDGSPDRISEFLNLQPTHVAQKGVTREGTKNAPKQSVWSLRSTPDVKQPEACYSIEVHWNDLARKIAGKEEQFKELSKSAKIVLTIIVKQENLYPPVQLTRDLLHYMFRANFALVDVDIQQ